MIADVEKRPVLGARPRYQLTAAEPRAVQPRSRRASGAETTEEDQVEHRGLEHPVDAAPALPVLGASGGVVQTFHPDRVQHGVDPAQLVVGAFVAFIALGTVLLWLPVSADSPGHVGLEDALFTSTSAATVTGLTSTDISRFSLFGELVILLLVQIGGFGIMTIGSVLAIISTRRVGLRQRILAQP